jgi:hypothetical protein
MYIELAWSRDGVRWERGLRGPWLKRGAPGEADCCMTHASHSLLDTGESHYLYYSGDDGLHNAVILNKPINTKVMLAEFGRNRFAGLRNHPGKTALAETSPFILCADSIRVNGNIAGGLKAELRDAHGRTLAGHSFEDSDLLKGDSVSGVLSWRGDGVLSSRKHEALSLSVKWNDGIIYEIDFK